MSHARHYPRRVPTSQRYFDHSRGRLDYLAHVSRRHRAVFVEVPKAGCTVVKRVLRHSEHAGRPYDRSVSVHDRAASPLGAPVRDGFDLEELFGPHGGYVRFGFVRNPFTRALSCYLEKIAGEQWLRDLRLPKLGFRPDEEVSFRDFLERVAQQEPRRMDIHWAPQAHLLGLDRVGYAFLGRFESFRSDLLTVMRVLDIDAPEELWTTGTPHTTNAGALLARHYDEECADLVRSVYAVDFQRLGYGTDLRFAGETGADRAPRRRHWLGG